MVHIKSHQNNWVAGTPVKVDARFATGIYTKDELILALACRKAEASNCVDSAQQQGE
jgi:hypothetical protein